MTRHLYLFICLFLLFACDDGDIITVDLEFEEDLELCENFEDSYLIFNSKTDPDEALILIIDKNEETDQYFRPSTTGNFTDSIPIDIMDNTRFIYRTYNRTITSNDFCSSVTPADLQILEDYEADSGTVIIETSVVDDDDDGIPSEDEDLNGNGNLEDDDSDLDGIPNYLDEDDDGDNVYTEDEIDTANEDEDDNPLTNPLDTDGDEIPDYLDEDDDNDGVLTRLEDEDGDGPLNDTSLNDEEISVPYFRNILENTPYDFPEFLLENVIQRFVTTTFTIQDINLSIINATSIEFGTYTDTIEITLEN